MKTRPIVIRFADEFLTKLKSHGGGKPIAQIARDLLEKSLAADNKETSSFIRDIEAIRTKIDEKIAKDSERWQRLGKTLIEAEKKNSERWDMIVEAMNKQTAAIGKILTR